MRLLLVAAALAIAGPAAATSITFTDLCPSAARVQRSTADPQRVEVYCVGEAAPRLTLGNCPAPARIETRGADKVISCPGGPWPVVVRQR